MECAGPCEDGDPLAGIEDLRRRDEIGLVGQRRPGGGADTGVDGAVLVRRALHRFELLHVVRDDDAGYRALVDGDAHRPVHHMADLCRDGDRLDVLGGHVLEQAVQVHLLLVIAAERRARLLADDGHHRLMVRFGVVEAVQQVDRTGSRGGHAHAEVAGELGVAAGHERGEFFMACLDELHLVAGPVECAHQAVDAVSRIAEDAPHPPLPQSLEQVIAGSDGHSQ